MKKILAVILAALMCIVLLASCTFPVSENEYTSDADLEYQVGDDYSEYTDYTEFDFSSDADLDYEEETVDYYDYDFSSYADL